MLMNGSADRHYEGRPCVVREFLGTMPSSAWAFLAQCRVISDETHPNSHMRYESHL